MDEPSGGPTDPPAADQNQTAEELAAAAAAEKKRKKKKAKVRSAWISFAGRIVAQVVGAAATIVLGIYLVTNHKADSERTASTRVARAARAVGSEPSLAVLPFDNYSGDASQDFFVNGMTEALIADLARVQGLRVISRTSSMHYQGQKKAIPEIAQELNVNLLVEGSVARSGNRVRVTAQLIDGASDEHIWARSYEDEVKDVLTLQTQIATAIAGEIRGAVSSSASPGVRRAVDPAVYDLYLRGRNAWNQRTAEGFEQATTFFQQAIDKDPAFALAYAGLADTYQVAGLQGGSDGAARARQAAEQALALDDTLGEAHASLAATLHRPLADVTRADVEFRRAIELNPGNATAHQWYAIMLAEEGRDAEALEHGERAVALDPLSGVIRQSLGLINYYGRRYDRAVGDGRRALELNPQLALARQIVARSMIERGRPAEAVRLLSDQPSTAPEERALLAIACNRSGDAARAATIIKELAARDPQPAGALARWYVSAGDRDRALTALEQMAAGRPGALQPIKNDPAFDRIKTTPRFRQLLSGGSPRV